MPVSNHPKLCAENVLRDATEGPAEEWEVTDADIGEREGDTRAAQLPVTAALD